MLKLTNSFLPYLFLGLIAGLSNKTMADFNVPPPPVCPPCGIPNPPPQYGNGQNCDFRRAIEGGCPSSPQDAPFRDYQRFYVSAHFAAGTLALSSIVNRSADSRSTGTVVKGKQSKSQTGMTYALGYIFDPNTRLELEYIVISNLIYTANPVLANATPSQSLTAEIQNNTVMLNGYLEMSSLDRLKPYVIGSLGISANSVTSTLTPSAYPGVATSGNRRTAAVAWGLGVGARMGLFQRWFLDFNYRYVKLAQPLFIKPPDNNFKLQGQYGLSIFSIGLIYLL